MCFLARIPRNGAGLFGEGEIGISGLVGCLHGDVAGERCGDAKLLLAPIAVGETVTEWRLDQTTQPDRGAEDVAAVARLVAPGPRLEGGQERTVAAIPTNGEVVQAEVG